MSFSGKWFRRTGGSNLEDFLRATNADEKIKRLLETNAPTWCFTRINDQTWSFHLQCEKYNNFNHSATFNMDEEQEHERRDGTKIKITFSLEGDNVLKQVIKHPDGKIAYFRREFGERNATMTITMEGADVRKAYIFYEMVA